MKKFNYLTILGLLLTAAFGFTGCSDDDDEDNGTPKKDNSYITTGDGDRLLLTYNGESSFEYNANGLLTQFRNRNNTIDISYNPNVLSSDNGDFQNYSFSLNGAGYVSGVSGSFVDDEDGYWEKGAEKVNYSYDGNGHLTAISISSSYTGREPDGETFSGSSIYTSIFTWVNGNLTKVVTNYKYNEDGEQESGTDTYTLTYGENAKENALGQFSHSLAEAYIDVSEDLYQICFAGLFGKPSRQFPTSVKCVDEEGYQDFSINPAYSFNSNGTLARENHGPYKSYSYSYSNANTETGKAAKVAPVAASKKSLKGHRLFLSLKNR